ncbi:hypothetical protein J6U78_10095 [bacterium]|jgi:hypothetical protein|nr:hypothetical protein [bacterium]MBR4820882.1 hypothetical protein [bacterium]
MRAIWSFIKFVIFVVILLLVLCVIFRNWVVKTGIEKGTEFLGVPTTVQSVNISIEDPHIEIRDLAVSNPVNKGFNEDNVVYEVRRFFCDYDIMAMFKKNVHVRDVQIDLRYFNVELSKDGQLNILNLKPDMIKDLKASQGDKQAEEELQDETQISVDKLMVKLDTLEFQSSTPAIPSFKLDLNYSNVFENLEGTSAEIGLKVLAQVVSGTPLSGILKAGQIDLSKSAEELANQFGTAVGSAKDAANQATDTAKGAVESVGEAAGKAVDAVKGLFKK